MFSTDFKTAELILMKFSGNLRISLAGDLVKFAEKKKNSFTITKPRINPTYFIIDEIHVCERFHIITIKIK